MKGKNIYNRYMIKIREMRVMEMKKVLSSLLKKATESSMATAKASFCGFGVEKMPESMKNNR
ncbi:hypothetical protein ClosIBUN22A_CONTIG78g01807 [Clostridium sp. IBUN22A]|nr:hypothetical protein ClosIBUN125C_CONTIG69g03891 [Clostridium sp. IBUN125C]KJZ85318.1 hypothetical protein ClosIBUN22A_CONTIG78g01807 [Clostridium sp. IBUN22A]KJZ95795.1 hypothetical protein ClosIBUN62F_CONTIG12g00547 [Clostridium sp. IBUN62F]